MTRTYAPHAPVRRDSKPIGEFMGSEVRVKASIEDTGGAFSLIDYATAPGWPGPPRHLHERTDEGFFILECRYRFRVAGEEHVVGPGDWLFVPRGTPHRFTAVGDRPGRFLALFAPGGFEGYFREVAALLAEDPTWPPKDPSFLAELGERYDQRIVEAPAGIH